MHARRRAQAVFRKWEASLKILYEVYAGGNARVDGVSSTKLMDYPEWLMFCKVRTHTNREQPHLSSLVLTCNGCMRR